MPRPFPDINPLVYVPDKIKLKDIASLLTDSNIIHFYLQNVSKINLPLVFLSSTRQAICTGRQEL